MNSEHFDRLRQGVKSWNDWRKSNPLIAPLLAGSDLRARDLSNVNFDGANFCEARFSHAALCDVDLSTAYGLGQVRHHKPTSVAVGTLLRSQNPTVCEFFEQAGVPEHLIAYSRSLTESLRPIQFYSC